MRKLEREVGDIADDFLETLLLAERKEDLSAERRGRKANSLAEEAAWGCDYHLIHEIAEKLDGGARYLLLPDEGEDATKLFWPIDVGMAVEKDDGRKIFMRFATAQSEEIRGLTRLVPPRCATLTNWQIEGREYWSETHIIGRLAGKWVSIRNPIRHTRTSGINGDTIVVGEDCPANEEFAINVDLAFATRLSARYDWHVAFGFNDTGPRLVLPTNPRGCLDLFKSRDLAAGEKRRSALRHWVNTHYRGRSNDPGALDFVREHLRGNTRFIWNGLDCELMVSEYDLEKNEFFRLQAAEWRAMRKHNRVRVRVKSLKAA